MCVTGLSVVDTGTYWSTFGREVVSASSTVGSTLGITPSLSNIGKTIIIFMMFAGRVGPLTIAYALARQQHKNKGIIKYPEEKILVG